MTAERIVVLSDLHANARALREAVKVAAERKPDRWIVLGDLLTYGVDIEEVLDIVHELSTTVAAAVVRGNHDQLYFDLATNKRGYYDRLPDWIRESVDDTAARLDFERFANTFPWCDEVVVGDLLFSHASPFGAGDWRYLNSERDLLDARACLRARGLRIGVFGHVHRHRILVTHPSGDHQYGDATSTIPLSCGAVLTAGSLGQPRDGARPASMLLLEVDGAECRAEYVPVHYDVAAHVSAIRSTTMSDATKSKLCEYFR